LKVLRADGCPWDKWTCAWALKGGHLVVLQWLRSNGCPWDEQTCSRAALGGHLEVLQWARANGCPWDEKAILFAAQNGHETVVRALIEAGADINKATDNGGTPLFMAAQRATRLWCGR
jgi:uncharacterized protein YabN with tetrapyrrole methylase and pyrophosphatase domain